MVERGWRWIIKALNYRRRLQGRELGRPALQGSRAADRIIKSIRLGRGGQTSSPASQSRAEGPGMSLSLSETDLLTCLMQT